MRSVKSLISVQEAAGYAMAPPADEADPPQSVVVSRSLDDALRLGHLSASRTIGSSSSQALIITKVVVEPAKAAFRGVMSGLWTGKAPA